MNPKDIFGLAQYAHQQLEPLMEPLDANLEIILDFDHNSPRIQLWVFPTRIISGSIAHKTSIKTQEEVEELIEEVKALASVAA